MKLISDNLHGWQFRRDLLRQRQDDPIARGFRRVVVARVDHGRPTLMPDARHDLGERWRQFAGVLVCFAIQRDCGPRDEIALQPPDVTPVRFQCESRWDEVRAVLRAFPSRLEACDERAPCRVLLITYRWTVRHGCWEPADGQRYVVSVHCANTSGWAARIAEITASDQRVRISFEVNSMIG